MIRPSLSYTRAHRATEPSGWWNSYDVATDFFFSGHTAIAVLASIEVANPAGGWLAVAAGVIAAFEALTVLVLRAHYTMDVLTAVVAAFCADGLASRLCVGF
jgi:hypothetical protein